MVGVTATCVPTYQGLSAPDLLRGVPTTATTGFPLDVPGRLSFYRARNAIYHLFRALVERNPRLTVLAPDYNSGNEILAMRAAGAHIHYYPIDRRMQFDVNTLRAMCDHHRPDVVYVIHYVGWAQPVSLLADFCRSRGMFLVEDCALSLLSDLDERPLGSFGHWSVFCLYKTLPVPNGALLIQNGPRLDALARLQLRDAGFASQLARTAELLVQRVRGRVGGASVILQTGKRVLGQLASAAGVARANVGDIGFNMDEVDLAMSPLSVRLLDRFDIQSIRERRIENYRQLDRLLDPSVARVFRDLPEGTCPLFFPILTGDKHETALDLHRRGVDALEFWNESSESGKEMSDDAQFLRAHVLELPIHQDLTPRQIAYMAKHVSEVAGGRVLR
jgi:dTDP-4-amino-4,6-dideoxygalactose transaminase